MYQDGAALVVFASFSTLNHGNHFEVININGVRQSMPCRQNAFF
jgi:hypothetical protein